MQARRILIGCATAIATLQWIPAQAGPGDVFVPAHRTRDGTYVPANVPTSSGGTRASSKPRRVATARQPSTSRETTMPPIFVAARPISR